MAPGEQGDTTGIAADLLTKQERAQFRARLHTAALGWH